MGGALSSLSKPSSLSGKEFKDHPDRRELQTMSDALFKFMYSRWRPNDVFDIVDKPGEYIIAVSDLITQQFHVLGYTTKSKKIGEFYFRKWKNLDPPKSAAELSRLNTNNSTRRKSLNNSYKSMGYNESSIREKGSPGYKIHEQHAKIIAFYFVRLFQILGSLLLVIKDTDINDSTITTPVPNSLRSYAQQLTYPKFRPTQSGGGIQSEPLGAYEFLRRYLRDFNRGDYEANGIQLPQTTNNSRLYKVNNSDSLFFMMTKSENIDETMRTDSIDLKQAFIIVAKASESDKVFSYKTINVSLSNINFIGDVRGYKAPVKFTDKRQQYSRYPSTVDLNVEGIPDKNKFHLRFNSNDLFNEQSTYTDGISYKISDDTDIARFIVSSGAREMNKILERYIVSAYNTKNRGATIIPYKKKEIKDSGSQQGSFSGKDEITDKNKPSIKILQEPFDMLLKKDKPHCIKRALDLLDASSMLNISNKDGKTTICESKVNASPIKHIAQLYGKLDVNKFISVNETEFAKAIEFLDSFVNKESEGSAPFSVDKLKEFGQESESKELSQALQRLSKSFNKNKDGLVQSVADIKVELPGSCSSPNKPSSTLVRGGPLFSNVQTHANQLLAFHLNNVIDISKFLRKIFNITQRPDGSWDIKGPKNEMMFAGFDILDEITNQARKLLLNYYTGCEDIYQKGVAAWDTSDKAPAAVNAPGRVVSAAPLQSGAPMVPGQSARPPGAQVAQAAQAPPGAGAPPAQAPPAAAPPVIAGQPVPAVIAGQPAQGQI